MQLKGIAMTKHQLEQVYYTNREIRLWERELYELKSSSSVSSPLPHIGTGSTSDPTANNAQRVIELENKIAKLKSELQSEREEVINFILNIPDSVTRMIVYYRCVKLMSWRKVAFKVGGDNSEESVRQTYSRFMRNLSQMSQMDVV